MSLPYSLQRKEKRKKWIRARSLDVPNFLTMLFEAPKPKVAVRGSVEVKVFGPLWNLAEDLSILPMAGSYIHFPQPRHGLMPIVTELDAHFYASGPHVLLCL